MKTKLRTPFFEVGVKNYIFGDAVLELALAADQASEEYDIDLLFIAPYTEIRRVAEKTRRIIVLAPYMDTLRPGRGMADVLPEAVKAAGGKGVVLNHCERPMSLGAIQETIQRANELELLSFACANSIPEAQALAHLGPDIINPEPKERIGSGETSDSTFVRRSIKAIKRIDPRILVEQAAGISNGEQVYRMISAGAEAVGAASGIMNAPSPCAMLREMVCNVRRAYDDLQSALTGQGIDSREV